MFAGLRKKLFGRTKPEVSPPAIPAAPSETTRTEPPLFYWMRHGPSNANVVYNACKKRTVDTGILAQGRGTGVPLNLRPPTVGLKLSVNGTLKNNTSPITKKECNATINQITGSNNTRKATNNNLAQMSPVGKMLTKIKTSRAFAHTKIFNPDLSVAGVADVKALLEKLKARPNSKNNKLLDKESALAKYNIKLDNTIIFCSTLIRAIETGLLGFDRNTVDYRFFDVAGVTPVELTDEQIRKSVFVIPYIKESGVIDTLDNWSSTLDNTNSALTEFYKDTNASNTKQKIEIAGDGDSSKARFNELRNKVSRSRFYDFAEKYFPGLQQREYKIIVISHEHTIKKFTGISKTEPMPNLSIIADSALDT